MPWLQAHLTVGKEQAPLAELLFENLGALSVTLGDAGDEALLEPAPGESPLWQATRVTGLFSEDTDADWLRGEINLQLGADISRQLQMEWLADQQWERSWLEHFKPMRFGQRLWVCPTGQQVEAEQATIIELDPGLAFGTGTHPTTALCLRWLDGQPLAGERLIDFGCGSGILAVAGLKLGAAQAVGIDHDPQALLATRDNAAKNAVAGQLTVLGSNEPLPAPAGVLVANILAGVLIELAPRIAALVLPGGRLALSGILANQATDVADAFAPYFALQAPQQQDDWVLLAGQRLT